jgi:hypothetical protein
MSNEITLPPLPETTYKLFYEDDGDEDHGDEGYQEVLDEPGYTANQMHAYARAALAQAPAAEPLTDEQIIKCLQAAGVRFQRFYSPAKKRWLDSTAGSIDSSVLIEGVRGALAKEQP